MAKVRETDLIGIGKKFQVETEAGDDVVIVIHDDGRREIYLLDAEENESQCVMTLNDQESRQIAGIVGGLSYKPKGLETIEVALHDLVIEWYKIPPDSVVLGKTIGDLEIRKTTGAVIIAAIGDDETVINPGPQYALTAGKTLVLAGKRNHLIQLKNMLLGS